MTDHVRKPAQSNQLPTTELSDEQLDEVSGGLNPQPLPPRWAAYVPNYLINIAVKPQFRF